MEWTATLRYARISPRKARLVADLVRDMKVDSAMSLLEFTPKKAAGIIKQVMESALHNAKQSAGVNEDSLYVSRILIDEGPTAKRWRPRAMGRATRIRKKTSHITLALEEQD